MKKRKTYEVSVINKTYSKTYSDQTKFYTSDTALELNFQLKEVEYDFDSAEIILLNVDDRSLVTRPVVKSAEGFTCELEDDIVEHYGEWKAQLKFEKDGEIYVSSPVVFRIENDLSNDRPPQLTEVNDWETLRRNANKLIAEMGDIVSSEAARVEAEQQRVEAEKERVNGYMEVKNIIDNFEIGENAVGSENIKDNAITTKKTNFILNAGSSVIMDENTPIENGHLDQYTGVFTPSKQATTIPVTLKPNTAYKLIYHATTGKGIEQTFPRMIIIYDMDGNFVERLSRPEQLENIIYPVERQIRVNYNLELADGEGVIHDFRLYEINPSLESQPKLDSKIKIQTDSLLDRSVSLAKIGEDVIAEQNPNVININTPFHTGYIDFTTGAFTRAMNRHYTTDYHELEQGVAYRLDIRYVNKDGSVGTAPRVIGVYNSDNSFSRGITNTTEAKNFTLIGNEKYVRVNFSYLTSEGGQLEVLRLYPIDEGYLPSLRLNSDISIDANAIDGLDGVQGYDQDLNTSSDVSFNSVSTNGQLPTGTLTTPPMGLVSGDVWADTTDSEEFPILRVKL